jgi:hypothetical protein
MRPLAYQKRPTNNSIPELIKRDLLTIAYLSFSISLRSVMPAVHLAILSRYIAAESFWVCAARIQTNAIEANAEAC